jgi:hypothetical protein
MLATMSIGRLLLILLFVGVSLSLGEVIRVPEDAPTIQAALDAIADGDTVLVAVGEYAEALHAPPLSFVLRGRVLADTGDYPRPVVDPSRLPGSDSLACLILPANSHPIVEDMKFRNGPAMSGAWGGIRSASPDPVLRRCCLDSLYLAFHQDVDSPDYVITLESCLFRHDSVMCVRAGLSQVRATDCLFSGYGFWLVTAGGGSRFVRCRFRDNDQGHLLVAYGRDIEISGCIFGPYGPYAFVAVDICAMRGSRICDNLFTECQPGMGVLSVSTDTADGVLVQGNVFINNQVVMGQGFAGMGFGYWWDGDPSQSGIIQDNIFTACSTNTGVKGLSVGAPARVNHNRFADLSPPSRPAVMVFSNGVVLRNNVFERNGLGINTENAGPVDARWNWWGDSTGPYHSSLNPEGRGDEVQGNVEFIPWYSDTSFLYTTPRGTPSPEAFDLQAYPNPFNAGLSIRFRVPDPGIFRVELFDVLGRRATELHWGPVAGVMEIEYDARTLSSGVYFIRATDTIFNRSVAMCKVVHLR